VTFDLVEAEKARYPKALMCRALGLSRSGLHAFESRVPSRRQLDQQRLDVLVAALFAELGGHYGAPRIERELRRRGRATSRKRVAASMAKQGLFARQKRRWKRTTNSAHAEPVAPNLLKRNFSAVAPDRVWVADTTYLPVTLGFVFLVVILDLFSRKVVGWAVGDRLDAELSGQALRDALAKRRPPPGLVFHSDRGIEFAAGEFRRQLKTAGAVQSMSRKGDCWDNAVAESFFSTLEFEGPATGYWLSATDAIPPLFAFIEAYYNAKRLHSFNDYKSPNESEADWRTQALAA